MKQENDDGWLAFRSTRSEFPLSCTFILLCRCKAARMPATICADVMPRYNSPLTFPMPDSFPSILSPSSRYRDRVAIRTALATSTRVSARLKALQRTVYHAITFDQREVLSNTLSELASGYEEGWEGDSDSSEDE